MLEVGWSEILVIALILIIVVGPKDLPQMLRTFGKMATRLRGMANEFKGQFDEAMREADLDDVRKGLDEVKKLNPTNTLRDAINPIRKLGEDIKSDLKKASDMSTPETTQVAPDQAATDEASNTLTGASPAEPLVAPIAAAVEPPSLAKISEPAPLAQPFVPNVIEPPAVKPKATRKKAVDAAGEAVVSEPKTKKAPVLTKDAAVAAVAAETVAKKATSRKKSAVVGDVASDVAPAASAKPKKNAPRKKADETGDA